MNAVQRFIQTAKGLSRTVVLPEGQDSRVAMAARRLKDEGIAEPIVLGKPHDVAAAADKAGVSLSGITVVNPADSDKLDAFAQAYVEGRDLSLNVARRMVRRPLYFAGMMVALGDADTMVAGVAHPTALVIQAGVLTVGLADGIRTPSSFFLMIVPGFLGGEEKMLLYADCAVNIAPTADELADIATASAQSARGLLAEEPRVAMLSFSTHGSASHPDADKVTAALNTVRTRAPQLSVDGELQVDAAVVPAVAAKKIKNGSSVAGQANVLVFPRS